MVFWPTRFFYIVAVVAMSIGLFNLAQAEEKDRETMDAFLTRLEEDLFSESPNSADFLLEYRTGNWSWDVSEIVRSYKPDNIPGGSLIQTIEASILDVTEISRFSEEIANENIEAREINRYYLDPIETDYLRNFSHYFEVPLFPDEEDRDETRVFQLTISIFRKHGEATDTINAYLFWRHQ